MANDDSSLIRPFLSYSGVKLPLNLMTPLKPEQLANRNTYFLGYFDKHERLMKVQKIVYAETEFEHQYHYDDSGRLIKADITDIEGEVTSLQFNMS